MYQITHHYLTMGDDNNPVVETEYVKGVDIESVPGIVEGLLTFAGGGSGTTISLTVSLSGSTSL